MIEAMEAMEAIEDIEDSVRKRLERPVPAAKAS